MKIFKLFLTMYSLLILYVTNILSANAMDAVCAWLPWCSESGTEKTSSLLWAEGNIGGTFLIDVIQTLLQYVSVVAVVALMLSWVLYLISGWEEEKVKKAKTWIIWALVWVLVSSSAWFMVDIVNNFSF